MSVLCAVGLIAVTGVLAYRTRVWQGLGSGEHAAPQQISGQGSASQHVEPAPGPLPEPSSAMDSPPSARLTALFDELRQSVGADIGLAVAPVQDPDRVLSLGDWKSGPAWSTIKVPLSLASLRDTGTNEVTGSIRAAITESDNSAAQSIWESLGDADTAKIKVESVLAEPGPAPQVQSVVTRPGFSAFGQTLWPLTDQARFLSVADCNPVDQPVLDLMADISSGQRWGLGTLEGARFKGGWGPGVDGGYLVRQYGVVRVASGDIAVAIAAVPESGSFSAGTAALGRIASWISEHQADFPGGNCGTP
ncbi:hypothetical protein [Mycobacterium sp. 141]|uniref:hypothetical protein n=1 Tax=Mycobacterium sp. 141 TaxID=1120797 RepID=UPI00036D7E99|nr:hypothetical protein [Mycobacterium sp. 141]